MRDVQSKGLDEFVATQPDGDVFQLSAWRDAVRRAYGHRTVCMRAPIGSDGSEVTGGLLPLVTMRHRWFGSVMVSSPFCDSGGVLAQDASLEQSLITQGLELASATSLNVLELRQRSPLRCLRYLDASNEMTRSPWATTGQYADWWVAIPHPGEKVRMVLDLPSDPHTLFRAFKAKLRSQIQKPIKEGLKVRTGGPELVRDFYQVFVENMRDLGSPVHSKRFVDEVVGQYGAGARVFVVYLKEIPLAASLTLGFKDMLSNPWASSLRRFRHLAPNMLLYWSMLEYACQNGYGAFDFGRSTVGEGTYRFKEQWGARPEPLYWYRFTRGDAKRCSGGRHSGGMRRVVAIWRRLPLSVTRFLGPHIRRHISL